MKNTCIKFSIEYNISSNSFVYINKFLHANNLGATSELYLYNLKAMHTYTEQVATFCDLKEVLI